MHFGARNVLSCSWSPSEGQTNFVYLLTISDARLNFLRGRLAGNRPILAAQWLAQINTELALKPNAQRVVMGFAA